MGMGKSNNKKKHNVICGHVWLWKDYHIVCVVMFGYGRGLAHRNAHTWLGLKVGLIVFQRTNISKMQIKI
jgi:hypothetical protein